MEQRACSKKKENRQEQDKGTEEYRDKKSTRLIKTSAKKRVRRTKNERENQTRSPFYIYFFIFFYFFS